MQGSLRREYVGRSLDLRSWETASGLVRSWEASGEVGVVKPDVPTVAEAVTKFIEDAGFRLLKQIDVGAIREFRTTWDDGAVYATKNLERMRAFFRFCE